MIEKLRTGFAAGGDFFQRLSGWTWFFLGLAGVVGGITAVVFSKANRERFLNVVNDDVGLVLVLALFLFLAIVLAGLITYAMYLYHVYTKAIFNEEIYYSLTRAFETFDEQFSRFVEDVANKPGEKEHRREEAVRLAIILCRQNILRQITSTEDKRIAFFETDENGTNIVKTIDIGLRSEYMRTYIEKLVNKEYGKIVGLAGRAIKTGKVEYEQDTSTPFEYDDPLLRFVPIEISPIASIACKSVMAGDRLVGVLCVDCQVCDVFSVREREILEAFAKKLRLIYSIFPATDTASD
jgi:hypothetical protein